MSTAWRTTGKSNQPTRRGLPVVAPYSEPFSRKACASSPCNSVTNGPSPTRVEYAFVTPMIWSNLRGDTPAPSHTPAAVGDEEVTYGYVP